jgi:hypothetical protein
MDPTWLVVGIPSYRNIDTVGQVVQRVAEGLGKHYQHLNPVLVSIDGHSLDQTLEVAMSTPISPSVRRIGTRYHGLPGKGTAIRAILEIAVRLGARACAVVEADVTTVRPDWVAALVGPVISGEFDMIVPRYLRQRPIAAVNDLLAYPFLHALFGTNLYVPMAGEFAISGFLAGRLIDKDVWETDVARAGVNVWLTTIAILEGYKLGQMKLSERLHRSAGTATGNGKFRQQVSTLFRLAYLQRRRWRDDTLRRNIPLKGRWSARLRQRRSDRWPALDRGLIHRGLERFADTVWPQVLQEETLREIRALLSRDDFSFPPGLWARTVFDFFVVHSRGEGDPDRVVESLRPLFHARRAAFLEAGKDLSEGQRDNLIAEQAAAFQEALPYFWERWTDYVPWDHHLAVSSEVRGSRYVRA